MEEVICQIKVTLKGISPQVMRRIQLDCPTLIGALPHLNPGKQHS
jgi:hypothetical protein